MTSLVPQNGPKRLNLISPQGCVCCILVIADELRAGQSCRQLLAPKARLPSTVGADKPVEKTEDLSTNKRDMKKKTYESFVASYHIMSYHIISYHIISYHVKSYHIISYRIISYHIISYHTRYHNHLCSMFRYCCTWYVEIQQ